jgi:hypothetical protein
MARLARRLRDVLGVGMEEREHRPQARAKAGQGHCAIASLSQRTLIDLCHLVSAVGIPVLTLSVVKELLVNANKRTSRRNRRPFMRFG